MSSAGLTSPILTPRRREHYKHLPVPPEPQVKPDRPWSQIAKLSVPNVLSNLAMYSTVVITTVCVSREDDPALLGAFGLGSLITNVLGLSIGGGLTSVLDTLVSQAYGADNIRLAGLQLTRARLVVLIAAIPCCLALFFAEPLLLLLQQEPEVARLSADYTKAYMIGLPAYFLYFASSAFLRSVQHPNPPLITNVIGSIVHLFITIWFVNKLHWGLWGAGLAMTINSFLRFAMLELFLLWKRELQGHTFTNEVFSQRGLRHFLGLGIPSFILVAVEWIAFEFQSVFAGWVSTQGLAAHIACVNVVATVFVIHNGIGQSLSTLVGASLGEGLPELAKEFTQKGLFLVSFLASIYGSALWYFSNPISRIYSTDTVTLEILESLLGITAFFVMFDAWNTTCMAIIRGLGLQTKAAKLQTVAMFGVMLPVGYLLYPHLGVLGIWYGGIAGMLTGATLFVGVLLTTDWTECSRRAIQESRMHILTSTMSDI